MNQDLKIVVALLNPNKFIELFKKETHLVQKYYQRKFVRADSL